MESCPSRALVVILAPHSSSFACKRSSDLVPWVAKRLSPVDADGGKQSSKNDGDEENTEDAEKGSRPGLCSPVKDCKTRNKEREERAGEGVNQAIAHVTNTAECRHAACFAHMTLVCCERRAMRMADCWEYRVPDLTGIDVVISPVVSRVCPKEYQAPYDVGDAVDQNVDAVRQGNHAAKTREV